jgi:hypothetical protein
MLSLPQQIGGKTVEVGGGTAFEAAANVADLDVVMAVTSIVIEQLKFTSLEQCVSAQPH